MPADIQVLKEDIINQIAAGEVVERPFSVVKELVENALDAGGTQIYVTLKNGGRDYMSVWDNGHGMSAQNLERSILRHATSKIKIAKDLEKIITKGFRGEALAAISSVSNMEIISAEDEKTGGTLIRANGGKVTSFGAAAFPIGTRVTVENLFFNTPARQRFMKNAKVELGHICEWITQISINCPQAHFKLIHDQKLIYDFPAVKIPIQRIAACIGANESENLLEFKHNESYLSLSGFICEPSCARASRRWQYIYVNGRFVKDKVITHALYEGYKTLLMKNLHPYFFLNIDLDPAEIDVNVHPSKIEIRMRNNSLVHTIVSSAIRKALKELTRDKMIGGRQPNSAPSGFSAPGNMHRNPTKTSPELSEITPFPDNRLPGTTAEDPVVAEDIPPAPNLPDAESDSLLGDLPENTKIISDIFPDPNPSKDTEDDTPFAKTSWTKVTNQMPERSTTELQTPHTILAPIGEFGKFIIAAMQFQGDSKELMIIDKHAAHERIRYEEIRDTYYDGNTSQKQALLTPLVIKLSPRDSVLIEKDLDHWQQIGFDIENFGRHTFKISALPLIFAEASINPEKMIREILDELATFGKSGKNEVYLNRIFEKMACHSSIRGEQSLSMREMTNLLDKLVRLDINLYCPHGRPVMIKITEYELEKRFKRIV